jgi:hypothetical protein
VAAFPFDLVAWTDTVQESLTLLTGAVKGTHPNAVRVFTSSGPFSNMANAQMKALGWKLLRD